MNLHALKYAIEEIYSIRFINDTNTVNNNPNEDVEPVPFPTFVFEFLTTVTLVRTITLAGIGMTRKCVSTTSAVRTAQGKVVTALLRRMVIFPPEQRRKP